MKVSLVISIITASIVLIFPFFGCGKILSDGKTVEIREAPEKNTVIKNANGELYSANHDTKTGRLCHLNIKCRVDMSSSVKISTNCIAKLFPGDTITKMPYWGVALQKKDAFFKYDGVDQGFALLFCNESGNENHLLAIDDWNNLILISNRPVKEIKRSGIDFEIVSYAKGTTESTKMAFSAAFPFRSEIESSGQMISIEDWVLKKAASHMMGTIKVHNNGKDDDRIDTAYWLLY